MAALEADGAYSRLEHCEEERQRLCAYSASAVKGKTRDWMEWLTSTFTSRSSHPEALNI